MCPAGGYMDYRVGHQLGDLGFVYLLLKYCSNLPDSAWEGGNMVE